MKLKPVAFAAVAAMFVPVMADAGLSSSGFFNCTKNTDGSGSCHGTFLAARNGPGATDQVSFAMDNSGYLYFGAVQGGVGYSCTKNATASSFDYSLWNGMMSDRNYYYVSWDATGTCSWVYVGNMSGYQSLTQ